jgi:hypothetical protein
VASSEWVVLRLKVQDRNRFIADTKAAGAAVRGVGRDAQMAGGLFQQGAHHGFLWNLMLFTLRRTIYGLTLATVAMGSAAVVAGFQFNSMVEQQTLAFKTMTGSAAAANKEVGFLFNLAAHGPFEFQQVITGARQLQAFGFTVSRTNQLLVSLQDAMAGMGLDQSALDRATLALGQIQSSGRLLGQDLRQLEQLGLVNPQDFSRRLGIDPRQIANVGALNIPSDVAINAIMAYWQDHFKGAAKAFQRTWVGELSTLKDIGSQTFGVMTLPLQKHLERDVLPVVTQVAQQMQKGFKQGGAKGALGVVDARFGTDLTGAWTRLIYIGAQLRVIVVDLSKAFRDAWRLLGFGGGPLQAVGLLLRAIAGVITLLNPILKYLIVLWVADRLAILSVTAATKAKLVWDAIEVGFNRRRVAILKLLVLWQGRERLMTLLSVGSLRKYATATTEVFIAEKGMYKTVLLNNGIMARFVRTIMFTYIPALRLAAATTMVWVTSLTLLEAVALVSGILALAGAIYLLATHWKQVSGWVKSAFQWMNKIAHFKLFPTSLHDLPFGLGDHAGFGFHNPFRGMAGGGVTQTAGGVFIAEHGPELVHLPAGATVTPLTNTNIASVGDSLARVGRGLLQLEIPVILDRREIARAAAQVDLDAMARA